MSIKKIIKYYYLIFSLLLISQLNAQVDFAWYKTYGNSEGLNAIDFEFTNDKGAVILGSNLNGREPNTYYSNGGLVLTKIDSLGNEVWQKEMFPDSGNIFWDIELYSNSGYLILGTQLLGYNKTGILIRTNLNGDTLWTRRYANEGYKILTQDDGSFILVGKKYVNYKNKIWLAKIDSLGNNLWSNEFECQGPDSNFYQAAILEIEEESREKGYLLSVSNGWEHSYLLRTDLNGNKLWDKYYNNLVITDIKGVTENNHPDSGFVMIGHNVLDPVKMMLLLVQYEGEQEISYYYTLRKEFNWRYGRGNSLIQTKNGYLVSGFLAAYPPEQNYPFILELNSDYDSIGFNIPYSGNGSGKKLNKTENEEIFYLGSLENKIFFGKISGKPRVAIEGDSLWIDEDWDGFSSNILDGTKSISPTGYKIGKYEWFFNNTLISFDSIATIELPTGDNVITLTVTDENGISSTKDKVIKVCSYRLETNGWITSSISTIGDSLFFATSTDDQIYCFDRKNNLRWTLAAGGDIQSTTTIGPNGNIYVGSDDTRLYCFDPLGNFKWDTPMGGVVSASPAVNQDRTIYVGTENNRLYSVNGTNGEINWNYLTGGPITSSASISSNGDIYFGSTDKKFYSLSSTGSINWSYTTNGEIHSSPAIDTLGRIYFGSNDAKLYALNMEGSLVWSFTSGNSIMTSPVIDQDGNVYFGSLDKYFYCIDNSGNEVWKYANESQVNGNPSLTKDGNVIYGCTNGDVVSLDKDGNLNWSYKTNSAVQSAPIITEEGRIYVGSTDNSVYGFIDPENAEINLNHQWPTFQKDTKRSGSQTELVTSLRSENIGGLPTEFHLIQNYPNPFNPVTTINYSIPVNGNAKNALVKLKVYDVLGKEIVTLVNENQNPGYYKVDFNAANLASGIYYYQITYGSYIKTLKMLLLK